MRLRWSDTPPGTTNPTRLQAIAGVDAHFVTIPACCDDNDNSRSRGRTSGQFRNGNIFPFWSTVRQRITCGLQSLGQFGRDLRCALAFRVIESLYQPVAYFGRDCAAAITPVEFSKLYGVRSLAQLRGIKILNILGQFEFRKTNRVGAFVGELNRSSILFHFPFLPKSARCGQNRSLTMLLNIKIGI
jgi:hypothetical protein